MSRALLEGARNLRLHQRSRPENLCTKCSSWHCSQKLHHDTKYDLAFETKVESVILPNPYSLCSCCDPTLVKKGSEITDLEATGEEPTSSTNLDTLVEDVDLRKLINDFAPESGEKENNVFGTSVINHILEKGDSECPICSAEPILDECVTSCWHMACKTCVLEHISFQTDRGQPALCHTCRAPISETMIRQVVRYNDPATGARVNLRKLNSDSTKVTALLRQLETKRREEPHAKSGKFRVNLTYADCQSCLASLLAFWTLWKRH